VKKRVARYTYYIGALLILLSHPLNAQDFVHLKDGTVVECHITEISDFILYADVHDDPYSATFFSDDVSFLKIDPKNNLIVRQLKRGVRQAMKYANPIGDNSVFGFYFGMPSDSLLSNKSTKILYRTDSLGNPILVPYDPMNTDFSERLKSLAKSLGGTSLAWLIGM
jgi:hypothetical protein